jgi:sugar O-acyltransferase (sialic acid O-acetyltransferase NeuD family)
MQPVNVPTTDVNSETAVIVEWRVADGEPVHHGEVIVEIETSKSVIEVEAPADGFVVHSAPEGAEVSLSEPIAHLAANEDELREKRASPVSGTDPAVPTSPPSYRATRSAEELATERGIDLATLGKDGLITTRDVEALIEPAAGVDPATLPPPLTIDDGRRRLLLIGAGLGATQVLDIVEHDRDQAAVGIVDDEPERWGEAVAGVPVVGGTERVDELFASGAFDAAVITISTSIAARTRFRELCEKHDVPLANVIDPTARLASEVELGAGNVVCAFCHLGVGTVVGDNNFLSAYNSFDHHSRIGDDISTGPGCMTSGLVEVGSRVRMGTGIYVEPKLSIGDDVVVASGTVLVTSVPDGHVVKAKSGRTVVSPRRL